MPHGRYRAAVRVIDTAGRHTLGKAAAIAIR
jgi:hypothetical protein